MRLKTKKGVKLGEVGMIFMSVLSLVLILKFPEVSIEYINRGLKLCVSTVIPSLFPFMVVSELIVAGGFAESVGAFFKKPARLLFGISGEGASAFFLGTLCGFPIGTRVAISLYERGRISREELSRLVCFSNNPSSAFVISAVGVGLFGCREFGVALYVITIASSVTIGIIQNLLLPSDKLIIVSKSTKDTRGQGGIAAFSEAVSSSASAMLKVCAFIVFFSSFTGVVGVLLSYFGVPQSARALLFSFFELTCGASEAACVSELSVAVLVAAFAVGWSGLSVHFQMIGLCNGISIPLTRYFLSKLGEGALNAVLVLLYFKGFSDNLHFDAKSVGVFSVLEANGGALYFAIDFFFVLCLAFGIFKRFKKKKERVVSR